MCKCRRTVSVRSSCSVGGAVCVCNIIVCARAQWQRRVRVLSLPCTFPHRYVHRFMASDRRRYLTAAVVPWTATAPRGATSSRVFVVLVEGRLRRCRRRRRRFPKSVRNTNQHCTQVRIRYHLFFFVVVNVTNIIVIVAVRSYCWVHFAFGDYRNHRSHRRRRIVGHRCISLTGPPDVSVGVRILSPCGRRTCSSVRP